MGKPFFLVIFLIVTVSCRSQTVPTQPIRVGAEQITRYLPLLRNKKVALFVNHTSLVGKTHLADTLTNLDIRITKVFSPEHGFRGKAPDGEVIRNQENDRSFELISLYGTSKKPTDKQLKNVDIMIIDIQDVGVRFYTYASTMTYLMESCARNKVPVLILDRPNPNGSYVDGPVLDEKFESFIGLHPVPIVHGLTLGELALMINGEGWLTDRLKCDLQVIPVEHWSHETFYSLPVPPSPNLPNDLSIALYPSLALFESTIVSVGRGTEKQFQMIGHPAYPDHSFTFIPLPNEGSKYPPLEGETCYGLDLTDEPITYELTLKYLIYFYKALKGKTEKPFFSEYFARHAGNAELQQQIEEGLSETEIKATWEEDLDAYRQLRNKYLLYAD